MPSPAVETQGVPRCKGLHGLAQLRINVSKQQMHVIIHETPRDDNDAPFRELLRSHIDEGVPIDVVLKEKLLAVPAKRHMVISRL